MFTIAGLQPEYGGPSNSVPALAEALAQAGVRVDLVTCKSSPGQAAPHLPPSGLVPTRLVSRANRITRWRSAGNEFARCLTQSPRGDAYSVVHDHGLWLPNNHAVAVASRQLGIPRVVSPRGMLTGWALQHRGWKKRMAWWLYQRRDLESATLLHATSSAELKTFREARLRQPVAVIPNGVNLPLAPGLELGTRNSELRTLLFLGRIHPIKGLTDLIEAWSSIKPTGWHAIFAGHDEPFHRQELELSLRQRGIERDFTFTGPVEGEAKRTLYRQADLFILPSHSENFGIVVAEALAYGVPVIATRGTPWENLVTHRCGWWTETGGGPLAAVLREAMALSDEARREMGQRGRRLVEQEYSWPSIATQMRDTYRWMQEGGPKPSCVFTSGGAI